jgi:hypothetical protein
MRLRQALRIIATNEDRNKQRFIYPKNILEIEIRIRVLTRNAGLKAEQGRISASNRLTERAQLWERILKTDAQNRRRLTI